MMVLEKVIVGVVLAGLVALAVWAQLRVDRYVKGQIMQERRERERELAAAKGARARAASRAR